MCRLRVPSGEGEKLFAGFDYKAAIWADDGDGMRSFLDKLADFYTEGIVKKDELMEIAKTILAAAATEDCKTGLNPKVYKVIVEKLAPWVNLPIALTCLMLVIYRENKRLPKTLKERLSAEDVVLDDATREKIKGLKNASFLTLIRYWDRHKGKMRSYRPDDVVFLLTHICIERYPFISPYQLLGAMAVAFDPCACCYECACVEGDPDEEIPGSENEPIGHFTHGECGGYPRCGRTCCHICTCELT